MCRTNPKIVDDLANSATAHTNLLESERHFILRLLFNIDQRHKLYSGNNSIPQVRIPAKKMTSERSNVSSDLIWEITRMFLFIYLFFFFSGQRNSHNKLPCLVLTDFFLHCTLRQHNCSMLIECCPGSQNAFLVKRKSGGGAQLSRDPLNLVNQHSRKVITC